MKFTAHAHSILFLVAILSISTASGQNFGPAVSSRRSTSDQKNKTIVTIEISSDNLESPGTQQRWMKMLQDVGADRVVAQTRSTGIADVDEGSAGNVRTIRIRGFLASGRLTLPGGKFRFSDTAKIKQLVQKFRDDGKETTLSKKLDFGLTGAQLVVIADQLATPVSFSTQGQPLAKTVDAIIKETKLPFDRDQRATAVLASGASVSQEYQGMSGGTALAAMLKAQGLVIQPFRRQGQSPRIQIKPPTAAQKAWPVGRIPKQSPVSVEPRIFQKLPIGIKNFPLDKVVDAFQKKAKIPFLYDLAVLEQEGIDLAQTKVTISRKDGTLAVMLGRLLRQSKPKMNYDLRVDDAGHSFLWITVR